MQEELKVLKIVAARLNKANIAYMISGSIAANYYTIPRMTRDIDIVIELKGSDIKGFFNIFRNDFYIDKSVVEQEVSRNGMFNIIHNKLVVKIDFIVKKETEFQKIAFSRRKNVIIKNKPIFIISPEDLILAKLEWAKDSHSELQIKDIRNIIKTVRNLDKEYIQEWISKLGLEQIYKEANPNE